MALEDLTGKQRMFVEYYLAQGNWNATKAAQMAGYAVPRQEGSRLLSNADIQAAIRERVAQAAMAADEVLYRLAEQARGTLDDFIDEERNAVNLDRARERGAMHLLKEYACEEVMEFAGRDQPPTKVRKSRIKLHDAQAALIQLGRHHGLFTDRTDLTFNGKRISDLSDAELVSLTTGVPAGTRAPEALPTEHER